MAEVYDNWERLVQATLRREELRITALRTPSDLSLASSSFNFSSSPRTPVSSFNFSGLLVGDSFSYHQILQATDYLSSSSLIKHGRSGDIFSGVLEDGLRVVVKKVDLSSAEKESYLRSELEFFGKVSHSRFVPFLGHCLENWNDKFLVYKYMPNKDLSSSLCGEMVSSGDVKCKSSWLDWRTRLKIATGVAQCLCYLHHECVPPLVHRNVEGSSILIDENFEAWLGSFTEVCTEKKDGNLSRLYKFLRFPMGYEQGTTGASNATCAYDVYCFGKILLELVTGKLGFSADTHPRSGDWMENALPYINTYDKELFMNIVNPSLLLDDHLVIEVWAVAIVAKACLSPKPSKRPQMTYILESLQDPKSVRLSTHENPQSGAVSPAPAKTRKAEHNEQGTSQAMDSTTVPGGCTASQYSQYSELLLYHIANGDLSHLRVFSLSELKAATENFRGDRLLGEGGFGKVYKGWLHEKSIPKSNSGLPIAIKRLNPESMLGFAEWQTEIYMLGRLSHRNLIRLLGYCWEDKQLILVHEFMPKGSLDNHLFRRGHAVQPLPWDIRLKILIGAARGLAYLHALKGQVVFRNLKTSSILLDGSYNAKLSNFCLAKIGPPDGESHVSTRVMGTYGYAAPEYIATGHLYVKSDVYGFGVVLAEMLTGLRVVDVNRPSGQHNLIDWIKPFLFGRRRIKSIMDSRLEGRYPAKAAVNVAHLALNCLVPEPRARPSMKEVVDALEQIESASEKAQRNRTNLVQQTAHGNDQQHLHHRSSTSAKE